MAVLSDIRIVEMLYDEKLKIDPFIYDHVQPASVDLTLNDRIMVLKNNNYTIFPYEKDKDIYDKLKIVKYILRPNEFILAEIRENLTLGNNLTGRIENRSSLARLGLEVSMGSFINPGYDGRLTITIKNNSGHPIEIHKGMRICQLVLEDVSPAASFGYDTKPDAKYQKEEGVVFSKLFMDTEYQEYMEKNSDLDLGEFLIDRLKEKTKSFDEIFTYEEKKRLGLIK